MSFATIVALIALALIAAVVGDFIWAYWKATSSGWQRVWDAGRGSATIVWQQLGLVAAALVTAGGKITDWICALVNDPSAADNIKSAIGSYVSPASVGIAMTAFIAVTIWARSRTLKTGS